MIPEVNIISGKTSTVSVNGTGGGSEWELVGSGGGSESLSGDIRGQSPLRKF